MSITLIGAGNVGLALGRAFTQRGVSVVFGATDTATHRDAVAALGERASLQPTPWAIAASDLVILAVPHPAVASIARSVPDWQGKILVDATNPIAPGLAGLSIGTHTSAAETLAQIANGARVVKAFNTTGAENLADAAYRDGLPIMPVCGDDHDARQRVMALATRIGFEAVDCGALSAARYLEPFAMLWIHLALQQGQGRRFAFSILRRD